MGDEISQDPSRRARRGESSLRRSAKDLRPDSAGDNDPLSKRATTPIWPPSKRRPPQTWRLVTSWSTTRTRRSARPNARTSATPALVSRVGLRRSFASRQGRTCHLKPTAAIRPTLSAREFAFKILLRLLRGAFWAARPKSNVLMRRSAEP